MLAGVLAFPLPYYSQGLSVQRTLQNAGVQYRVHANGFSRTLQEFSNELLAVESPNLFAAQLTFLRIDLATAKQDHLLKLGKHPDLQVVNVIKSSSNQRFQPATIQWLNSLPPATRATLTLDKCDEKDLRQLKSIRRAFEEIHLFANPASAAVIDGVLHCPTESIYFYDVTFPNQFALQDLAPVAEPLRDVRVHRCQLSGAQLVKIAECSGCATLNCDNLVTQLTVSDCEQLAALPRLENLLLGTTQLRFDQLQPLVASPQLKSFAASTVRSVTGEELEQLRALIPEGYGRRVRVDDGPGINVGDVPGRRGL